MSGGGVELHPVCPREVSEPVGREWLPGSAEGFRPGRGGVAAVLVSDIGQQEVPVAPADDAPVVQQALCQGDHAQHEGRVGGVAADVVSQLRRTGIESRHILGRRRVAD